MLTVAHCCQYFDYIHTFISLFGGLCPKTLYKVTWFWFVLAWECRRTDLSNVGEHDDVALNSWVTPRKKNRFSRAASCTQVSIWTAPPPGLISHSFRNALAHGSIKVTMITLERCCLLWPRSSLPSMAQPLTLPLSSVVYMAALVAVWLTSCLKW